MGEIVGAADAIEFEFEVGEAVDVVRGGWADVEVAGVVRGQAVGGDFQFEVLEGHARDEAEAGVERERIQVHGTGDEADREGTGALDGFLHEGAGHAASGGGWVGIDDADGPVGFAGVVEDRTGEGAAGGILADEAAAGVEGFVEFRENAERRGVFAEFIRVEAGTVPCAERGMDEPCLFVPVVRREGAEDHAVRFAPESGPSFWGACSRESAADGSVDSGAVSSAGGVRTISTSSP